MGVGQISGMPQCKLLRGGAGATVRLVRRGLQALQARRTQLARRVQQAQQARRAHKR